MAIQTAVPTKTRQPTRSSAFLGPGAAELGAHAGEEQGDGEQDDGEDVVGGALDVAAHGGGHHLGLGVEPLGVGAGLQLVLVHGERGRWSVGVGERVGGQPGVEGRAELGSEPGRRRSRRAPRSSVSVALTHWKNMAMSTWVWPSASPWARAASMRRALTRPEALVCLAVPPVGLVAAPRGGDGGERQQHGGDDLDPVPPRRRSVARSVAAVAVMPGRRRRRRGSSRRRRSPPAAGR